MQRVLVKFILLHFCVSPTTTRQCRHLMIEQTSTGQLVYSFSRLNLPDVNLLSDFLLPAVSYDLNQHEMPCSLLIAALISAFGQV